MGLSKKHQVDGGKETEGKKWVVIAGIALRAPLKSISTRTKQVCEDVDDDGDNEECSTTPTGRDSKIPEKMLCPPAPRKRRPASICHYNGVIEFFNPPDLESVFKRHVERAN